MTSKPFFLILCLCAFQLQAQTSVNFFGSAFNETVSVGGPIFIELEINADGTISGFLDVDPYPGGTNFCGAGAIQGQLSAETDLTFSYVSADPDPGCSAIDGTHFAYTCKLNPERTRLTGRFVSMFNGINTTGYVTLRAESQCPDLSSINENFAEVSGTNDELYTRQFLCLAEKSCQETNLNGEEGWSGGFVRYLFDYIANHNSGTSALEYRCSPLDIRENCFRQAGTYHLRTELIPAFFSYCSQVESEEDIVRWTNDHEGFLSGGVDECFDELITDDNVCTVLPNSLCAIYLSAAREFTRSSVTLLRDAAQAYCRFSNNPNSFYESLTNNFYQGSYFSDEMEALSDFEVAAESSELLVGASYQVTTSSNISTSDQAENKIAESYFLSVDSSIASISDEGVLTIHETGLPLATMQQYLVLFVQRGDEIGVGQFMLVDTDNDEDFLADAFEQRVGANPEFPDLVFYDNDQDGLNNFFEVLINTNPSMEDTDGDGYNDSFEHTVRTDPRDPNITPATNLVTSIGNQIETIDVNIYPNPFANRISIENASGEGIEKVDLIMITGERVPFSRGGQSMSSNLELETQAIPAGVYLLEIVVDGRSYFKKMVKN